VPANRKLADTGLLLGKKSRLSGCILRVAEIDQADANQAKPRLRAKADTRKKQVENLGCGCE
jgi:hypothetical protein